MHGKKFAATLQDADGGENPILIRIERKAGHGHGKPVRKVIESTSYIFVILFQVSWPCTGSIFRRWDFRKGMTEIIIGFIVSIVLCRVSFKPEGGRFPFYLKKDALVTIPREGFSNSPRGTVSLHR